MVLSQWIFMFGCGGPVVGKIGYYVVACALKVLQPVSWDLYLLFLYCAYNCLRPPY